MKKTIACICILFGVLGVRADVRTNYVYVVSNIFNNVYTESIVTQKVKSSHTDFYYTNYVSVVTNVYQTTFRTNVSVNVDVSQTYVNAAANAASNALSFASQSAASASAAGSSASSASSAASRAAASAASASSAASDGLQRINERINWFDLHSGETITQVNYNTNIDIHVAQTIVTNDFRHVPYDLDPNLEVNLNAFAMMGKGGTNNVYSMTCPSGCAYDSGTSIGSGTFRFWFDRFELVNGKGKFWYKSDYDTGVPNNFSGRTWRFEWAYWYEGVWHVAIRQRRMSGGTVVENNLYDMTLTGGYPSASGQFSNRPSYMWAASNSTWGRLTTVTYSTAMGYVDRLALKSNVEVAVAALSNYVASVIGTEVEAIGTRLDDAETSIENHGTAIGQTGEDVVRLGEELEALSNRVVDIESGSPHAYEHGGTVYSRITVYNTARDSGKVSAVPSSSSYYAAASYKLTPNYRYPTTDVGTWTFVPAYVDTDANGLRLQYVPTEIKAIRYSSSSSRYLVPEYLYWQNGYVYAKIKTYVNNEYDDGYVIGRVQDSNYPNNYTTGKTISRTSYNSWSSSSLGTIVGTSTISPAGSPVWFAETASPSIVPVISWMLTGK